VPCFVTVLYWRLEFSIEMQTYQTLDLGIAYIYIVYPSDGLGVLLDARPCNIVAYITCVLYLQTTHEPAYHNTQPVSHCPLFLTPCNTVEANIHHVNSLFSGIFCLKG
jgi:hypothetical protein